VRVGVLSAAAPRASVLAVACVFAATIALDACKKSPPDSAPATDAAPSLDLAHVPASEAPEPARATAHEDAGALTALTSDEHAFLGVKPTSAKSIGHTSVVFKIDFANGQRAAFKPRSKRSKTRYKGEIAAYRLARALGLPNVPPAFSFRVPAADLRAAMQGKDAAFFDAETIVEADGTVRGALIPWISKLEFFPIEADKSRAQWEPWLFDGAAIAADADRVIAADISTLIAFDTLTGNWDRWSGGNVGANGPGGHLLYIDNDGAFFDPVPPGPLARQNALVARTERFSRSFVEALRKLDAAALSSALGEETPGEPLLARSVLQGVEKRRKAALLVIDKKIAAHGEPAVLFFP